MNKFIKYGLILFILILLQLAIFNNIFIGKGIIIFIYILFFLILPVNIPGWAILFLGFITGFIIDSSFNSGGIHAFSTVAVAYIRQKSIKYFDFLFYPGTSERTGVKSMGVTNFIKFSAFIIFIHNFFILFIDVFSLKNFFQNLLLVILNTVLTTIICIAFDILFGKGK